MSLPLLRSGVVWLSHMIWAHGIVGSNPTCAIKELFWWSVLFSTKIFSLLTPSGWILIHPLLLSAVVAQLVEQSPCKRQVISSSLIGSFPNPVNMYDDCYIQRQASLEIFYEMEGSSIIKITKNEAFYLRSKGFKDKSDIHQTYSGHPTYYASEKEA